MMKDYFNFVELQLEMLNKISFKTKDRFDLIDFAVKNSKNKDGLWLEFGVGEGRSINFISRKTDNIVYGFDSFRGLPEDWIGDHPKGTFNMRGNPPPVNKNVVLKIGNFDEILPKFAEETSGNISFLHIDCDLYSSTKVIFDCIGDRIVEGTIIQFDELVRYGGFEKHEMKAFYEFVKENDVEYEYLGENIDGQQICVLIKGRRIDRNNLMISLEDFTFVVSVAIYPLAEMCIFSLKKFYPNAKIIMAFDFENQTNDKRKEFFSKYKNIEILEDEFNLFHCFQLHRMSKMVKTKYFITLDDDVFFHQKGIMEYLFNLLIKEDYSAVGSLVGAYISNKNNVNSEEIIVSPRFDASFMVMNTEDYFKYNMDFSQRSKENVFFRSRDYTRTHIFYDTGAFVFNDIIKNELKNFDVKDSFYEFIRHYEASYFWLGKHSKLNFSEKASKDDLFRINKEMVEYEKYDLVNRGRFDAFEKDLRDVIEESSYVLKLDQSLARR